MHEELATAQGSIWVEVPTIRGFCQFIVRHDGDRIERSELLSNKPKVGQNKWK